ncbi:MAG: ATP-binding cassette domain-containing protein, partial [Spirochaetaceae bacterium]|nr:ATP-binding cassette domain-containing protein [Spirochaetaceae bacterium]
GSRLRPEARAVRFRDRSISDVAALSITDAIHLLRSFNLHEREALIAGDLIREMEGRLVFLTEVGLGYLTLDRAAPTLSGGEAQRIRLAAQLGSHLRGVCYVLDEPTIGLHPRDNRMLLGVLRRLTDKGNTVLVVEHDEETIRAADYIVDLGPGGGVDGGSVVASGSPADIVRNPSSVTGRYLAAGRKAVATRDAGPPDPDARSLSTGEIRIHGATLHNLKAVNVAIPTGKLITVTGVSGSGKSTLVRDVLYETLRSRRTADARKTAAGSAGTIGCSSVSGAESIERILEVDQAPIGKTPRSIPATYIGVWDNVRKLFAALPESKMRGYTASRFSFNTVGGRCEVCGGQGVQRIEMSFLPDVTVTCDACNGRRFDSETLAVTFKGKNIADVLDMNVKEAAKFFSAQPKIRHAFELLNEVGLGYLILGQPSPTLSGGEAQRIKLVSELARSVVVAEQLTDHAKQPPGAAKPCNSRRATSPAEALYLLDEPTVGLHMADVEQLIRVLHRLVDTGATVVVIEHNLDVIAASDWVIDLGPEGGDEGGTVVATGTPRDIAATPGSYTGAFLAPIFR